MIEYSLLEYYNLQEITAISLHDLADRFTQFNDYAFVRYVGRIDRQIFFSPRPSRDPLSTVFCCRRLSLLSGIIHISRVSSLLALHIRHCEQKQFEQRNFNSFYPRLYTIYTKTSYLSSRYPLYIYSPNTCSCQLSAYYRYFPQILRGQHGLVAAGSGANMGLRGTVERGLRPPPLLHGHPIESRILQEVLLVVRVRARLNRPIHATALPVALPPRATRLRALGHQPVDFHGSNEGEEKRTRLDSNQSPRLFAPLVPPSPLPPPIHGGKESFSLRTISSRPLQRRSSLSTPCLLPSLSLSLSFAFLLFVSAREEERERERTNSKNERGGGG